MKTFKLLDLIPFLLLSIVLSNCTVLNRKYRSGFYLSVKKHPEKRSNFPKTGTEKIKPVLISKRQVLDVPAPMLQVMGLTTSALPSGGCPKHKPDIRPLPILKDSCGDRLIFQNGEEKIVRVFEISSKNVKYKPCDHLNGPMYSSARENLFMITYSNGSTELMEQAVSIKSEGYKAYAPVMITQTKKVNKSAKNGFIFALFSWTLLLAPVAFILGIIGLAEISNNPGEYSGMGFAIAAILIPVVFISMLILL